MNLKTIFIYKLMSKNRFEVLAPSLSEENVEYVASELNKVISN